MYGSITRNFCNSWRIPTNIIILILDTNERIFEEQIELFSFFFGTDTLTDSQRWDFVEEYFTGTTVEELKKKYGGSRPV